MSDIRLGTKVIVTNPKLKTYGYIGYVIGSDWGNWWVQFTKDGTRICCCFKSSNIKDIKELNEEDLIKIQNNKGDLIKIQNNKGEMNMMPGTYTIAIVRPLINDNKVNKMYSFALFEKLEVGAKVLCDTNSGYMAGEIIELFSQEEYSGHNVAREIICPLNFTKFEDRKRIRKQKSELKKKMDEKVKKNQEMSLYKILAKEDAELNSLLEDYIALGDF